MLRSRLSTLALVAASLASLHCGEGDVGDSGSTGATSSTGPGSTGAGATSGSGASSSGPGSTSTSTSTTGATGGGGSGTGGAGGSAVDPFSTDKTKFFGDSRCAKASFQICDDFESGSLDTATWDVTGDTPVVDGVQHARGSKALHITKVGNGASYIKETKTFPEPNDTYFGRIFVYFESMPTSPGMNYSHWTFVAASGTGAPGQIRVGGQLQNGANHFGVGTDTGNDPNGSGDWTSSDKDPNDMPLAVPTGEWLCIEWMHDGDADETRFWWDAVEHESLHTTASVHGGNSNPYIMPSFTNVWVGWQEYQTSTETFEMWVDEVAIDGARIGCVL